MLKKIDKLVLKSFIGPFVLTTAVVVFIFLIRFLVMYFSEFIGKDLGLDIFAKLFGYFSLITIPTALPLAVLLSSLVCFGNLGEFTELTAMKAAGIPTTRIFLPATLFSVVIAGFSFWFNVSVSPWANLKGYSMLYDIKTTKLTLDIEEGVFYSGIPGYSLKIKEKVGDGSSLRGVMIYDHRSLNGNTDVTLADSGRMYTINNNAYLVFELFNGYNFRDVKDVNSVSLQQFLKNKFKHNKLVMSLESFGLKRTSEESFKYHPYMKNLGELNVQIDSMGKELEKSKRYFTSSAVNLYSYHYKSMLDTTKRKVKPGPWIHAKVDSVYKQKYQGNPVESAMADVQSLQSHFDVNEATLKSKNKDLFMNEVELQHKYTQTFSIIVLFLIGAALGSIIKKGGFGMPVLLAIAIFILMYVFTQFFDKLAKEGQMLVIPATWATNLILSITAAIFGRLALKDGSFGKIDWRKILHFFKKKPFKFST